MFGQPCLLPPGANVLDLLWTYFVEVDSTKKPGVFAMDSPNSRILSFLDIHTPRC